MNLTAEEILDSAIDWYALRVFRNQIFMLKDELERNGARTYMAMKNEMVERNGQRECVRVQLAPSLLFVEWSRKELLAFRNARPGTFSIYADVASRQPAAIAREEMEMFIKVTSVAGGAGLELISTSFPFKTGDKVRVTGGLYKGAEGYIKRIKRDRKIVVAVSGVCVVALSQVPWQFVEKIENKT